MRTAPALHHRRELPAEIGRVVDAGVHAEAAGRREEMDRVAGQPHIAAAETIGDRRLPRGPREMTEEFDRHVFADTGEKRPRDGIRIGPLVDLFDARVEEEIALPVQGLDQAAHLGVDRPLMPGAFVSLEHAVIERGRAHMRRQRGAAGEGIFRRPLAAIADAEPVAHDAVPAVAADEIARGRALRGGPSRPLRCRS